MPLLKSLRDSVVVLRKEPSILGGQGLDEEAS